ncbi:MAG: hypothetical protein RL463_992 [Bacteroidota bacterium]|jgi:hypothetical protein
MALNWSTEKIKYFSEHPDELWVKQTDGYNEYDDVNAETKSLIFATMAVGIGSLSISTAADFYARFKILEKFDNLSVYIWFDKNNEKHTQYLTHEIVMKHIGLGTNVSKVNKTEWINKLAKSYENNKYCDEKPSVKEITKLYNSFVKEFEEAF